MTTPAIIEAAINGATRKADNPHVPVTAEEIAADALACLEAGASIIHNHIGLVGRDGAEAAEEYLRAWRPVLAQHPDALWYPTVNFGAVDQRYAHIAPLAASGLLRLGLCDPGSLNLGRVVDGLPAGATVYANSFDDIAVVLGQCRELGLGPSLAIYEPGFLRTVVAYHRQGRLPAGAMVKLYLATDRGLTGTAFGLPPTARALDAYLELLDGTALPWAVSVVGGDVVDSGMAALALAAGGHVHLGLEFYGGAAQPTNAELVAAAGAACATAGRPVASAAQAAELLGLPVRS